MQGKHLQMELSRMKQAKSKGGKKHTSTLHNMLYEIIVQCCGI